MTTSHPHRQRTARVTFTDGTACGLRNFDSLGSILQVRAAPFSDLKRMMTANLTHFTYVIDTARIYTGHGNGNRKIGDQLEPKERQQSQVFVIHSLDPRFDKAATECLEHLLIDVASKLGLPLANNILPFGRDGLWRTPEFEQLSIDAQFLLSVAGFRRFDEARQNEGVRPTRVSATADLHDVRLIEPEAMSIPADAVRKRLVCGDLKVEGYEIGKRFHVMPGAEYFRDTKSGLSKDNRQRREALEKLDIFQPLPGVIDRSRMRVGLDCRSAAIAGKIFSGQHIGNAAWQKAPCPGSAEQSEA